jgi:hypothetical protein
LPAVTSTGKAYMSATKQFLQGAVGALSSVVGKNFRDYIKILIGFW